jgi:hypothetical protein
MVSKNAHEVHKTHIMASALTSLSDTRNMVMLNKLKKFKQKFHACQKADDSRVRNGVLTVEFMQQGTTYDDTTAMRNTKKLYGTIQKRRHGILIYSVVLLQHTTH